MFLQSREVGAHACHSPCHLPGSQCHHLSVHIVSGAGGLCPTASGGSSAPDQRLLAQQEDLTR